MMLNLHPTNLNASKVTANTIELMWSDPVDSGQEYEVYRDN